MKKLRVTDWNKKVLNFKEKTLIKNFEKLPLKIYTSYVPPNMFNKEKTELLHSLMHFLLSMTNNYKRKMWDILFNISMLIRKTSIGLMRNNFIWIVDELSASNL